MPEYFSDVLWMGLKLKPVERIQTVPQLFKALTSQEYTAELTRNLPRPESRSLTLPEATPSSICWVCAICWRQF